MQTDTPDRPDLCTLCEPLLLFLAGFPRHAASSAPSVDGVRARVDELLAEIERGAQGCPRTSELFYEARYLLAVTVDGVIAGSDWIHRDRWPLLEARLYETAVGGARFFELRTDPAYQDPVLQRLFYLCLAVGFRGKYLDDPQDLDEIRARLRVGLGDVPVDRNEPITPNAAHAVTGDEPLPPSASIARFAIVALALVTLFVVGTRILYWAHVDDVRDLAQQYLESAST